MLSVFGSKAGLLHAIVDMPRPGTTQPCPCPTSLDANPSTVPGLPDAIAHPAS